MTNIPATETRISLDLSDIRKSLRELWASEALRDVSSIVQARAQNIVLCRVDGGGEAIPQPIVDLAIAHPGRTIVIEVEEEGEPRLEGSASVYCRVEGDKQVCGELITLKARGGAHENAHHAVVSLLLPDLPVNFWWHDAPPSDNHLFEEIAAQSDRLFFDSNAFADPLAGLAALAGLSGYAVSDLNWTRLASWRQLMARLFDVSELRRQLDHLRSIDVHYIANVEPYNPNRALLLLGWLAARLGWLLDEAATGKTGGYIFHFQAGGHLVKAEVVEGHASDLEKGELTGVFLVAGSDAPYVMPRVVMGDGRDSLEMRMVESLEGKKYAPVHAIPYAPRHPASLLAEALVTGHDPDYAGALAVAARLLAAAG
jgi:glucose-6-phosphate dehydrogenase assembly protein OpcA